jgi:hypothetical protein
VDELHVCRGSCSSLSSGFRVRVFGVCVQRPRSFRKPRAEGRYSRIHPRSYSVLKGLLRRVYDLCSRQDGGSTCVDAAGVHLHLHYTYCTIICGGQNFCIASGSGLNGVLVSCRSYLRLLRVEGALSRDGSSSGWGRVATTARGWTNILPNLTFLVVTLYSLANLSMRSEGQEWDSLSKVQAFVRCRRGRLSACASQGASFSGLHCIRRVQSPDTKW